MKNILIVDDEETVRLTLAEWFSSKYSDINLKAHLAGNGVEAIKQLAANKIDLLVTDLNMPKMDGFELLVHMKNDYPTTPIIVISAFATPEIKDKVTALGALNFVPKPFTFDDLADIDINKMMASSSAGDKGDRGFVNGISLQSFLQLVSMEGKTCTLTISSGKNKGEISLLNGELMNAKTGTLAGGDAAFEIVSWPEDGLTIEIDNECKDTEKKIDFPIMHLLMEAARKQDEISAREAGISDEEDEPPKKGADDTVILKKAELEEEARVEAEAQAALRAQQEAKAKSTPPPKPAPPAEPPPVPSPAKKTAPAPKTDARPVNLAKLNLMAVQEKFKEFTGLDGFSGAVLMTTNGEILQVVGTDGSSINLERASVFANSILSTVQNSTSTMGLGPSGLIQVDTMSGHLLIAGRSAISLMLILATSTSLGLAKVMVNTVVDEISSQLD